jgi:hypothetical protein
MMENAEHRRDWIIIFVTVIVVGLIIDLFTHGRLTIGGIVEVLLEAAVLASGILFGGAWLKKRQPGGRRLVIWMVLCVTIGAFVLARFV